jgi:MFS family permease
MMVSNLSAFLPLYAASNNWTVTSDGTDTSLSDNDISLILAAFSVAQVIFSPFNSLIKNWLGTKNTIVIGLILVMISTGGLGAIAIIMNGNQFRYIALGLRFIQGAGDIMLQITCYGVICQLFTDDIMKYIGYIEISVGVGNGIGPFLGG